MEKAPLFCYNFIKLEWSIRIFYLFEIISLSQIIYNPFLKNIIKNAVEHADNYVGINVVENKVYIKITIENDGEAIPKEDLPNIFKRFYRGKNATKDSIGIGLALAKTIISSENGYINVESKNNLTTFTVRYSKL